MQIYFIVNDINSLTKQYLNKLTLKTNEKKSTVVTLSISGPVPQQEADFLNKLCEVYIRTGLEEKNKAAINTIKFIDSQIGSISDSLKKAEMTLQNFRLQNRILDIGKEGTAIYSNLEKLQSEKAIITMQLRYYVYLKNYIESKNEYNDLIVPSIVGISEPVLNQLVTELTDLYKQKTVLSYSAQGNNPSISILKLKIEKTVDALKENIHEIINTTQLALKDIEERTEKVSSELQKLPVTERQLITIKRDFDLNNNIFTFLLQKRAEAGIAKASNMPDNKILDIARPENAVQISPKRSKIILQQYFW